MVTRAYFSCNDEGIKSTSKAIETLCPPPVSSRRLDNLIGHKRSNIHKVWWWLTLLISNLTQLPLCLTFRCVFVAKFLFRLSGVVLGRV